VALGIPGTRDWDDSLTKARAALNWSKHFELAFDEDTARAYHDEDLDVDTDFCAMCGHDWCSVRISKEIQDFASGKADGFERMGACGKPGAPIKSDALSEDQQAILKQRGYLKPEEIHKLAAKVKKSSPVADGGGGTRSVTEGEVPATGKLACHSDFVDPEEAKKVQAEVLVQLNTLPAHNLAGGDRLI
jgi:phosphomethylpyrimidine synthase